MNIKPFVARGTVAAPPSKSYAHRLMLCAALAEGTSIVRGISQSEDMLATLDCIAALGAHYERTGDTLTLTGHGAPCADGAILPCRESGSTLRFFIPLTLIGGGSVRFTGTERLMQRGVGIYEELFAARGITTQKEPTALTFSGALCTGDYTLRGDVSSQFVSGLLFALPLLDGDSTVTVLPPVESRAYIDITIDAMRQFGVEITEPTPNTFFVRGGQAYRASDVTVEGDWSNAAALYAFNAIGGNVSVTGLNSKSIQGDRVCLAHLRQLSVPDAHIDLSLCPDLGPVLFAVAAAKNGAVFTGTRRLRIKESDRAQAMAEELQKFGIETTVLENEVRIARGTLCAPTQVLSSHNDHRIIMALSLLMSRVGGELDGIDAIRKSFPNYFDVLEQLGMEITYADNERH